MNRSASPFTGNGADVQRILRIDGLPEAALDAAACFHAHHLLQARAALDGTDLLILVFPAASFDHRGWRLAAVQDLARAAAPKRVNGISGDDEPAVAATVAYLGKAPGVTGQLFAVSGNGEGKGPY
ncbi:Rossmann fold domain-containing protein [Altericroceibacterium xinjiangense]|uniref:Rossmann fold domain-containing protein n=1 Tax=Altericroceibacterium xinjiangense TaxID=762261 RepID=UPI001F49C0D2|nr:hypothetical protein [Altericroceibacterium xinjiangense]